MPILGGMDRCRSMEKPGAAWPTRARLMLAALTLLLAGCGSGSSPAARPAPPPGDSWYTLEDQHLAESIRQALVADPVLAGLSSGIGLEVQNGQVRLVGSVPTAVAKAEAGVCARWQAGPDQVENAIAIIPQAAAP